MPRQPRIEYPGAIYHVMARGDRQEVIVTDHKDRELFLRTMEEAMERSGWKVFGWVLMDNHYHWAIETPEANLVAGMKWFQNTYTRRFNSRHGVWGHLFGGRYKAIPVEGTVGKGGARGGDYLAAPLDYIHLNPARAGLVSRGGTTPSLADYSWSSLSRDYTLAPRFRKPWMAVAEGLGLYGLGDTPQGRRDFIRRLEERAQEGGEPAGAPLRGKIGPAALERGWYLGGEAFREKLLSLAKAAKGNRNYGSSPLGREQNRNSAEEWITKGKAHFEMGDDFKDWRHRTGRVAIAWALHRRTNQPQAWIAEALGLRTAANVSQQVRRFQKEVVEAKKTAKRSALLQEWIEFVKNC